MQMIHSDEWPAYSKLYAMGYHSTVNHQRHMWIQRQEHTFRQLSHRGWMLKR
ncbi:hypothetical protein E2C01_083118 [Portunus trituberculatus]|uniref:ISXO2-like transposase domain-containing protein n=1 Tax=Portunus trituberculatus TaxID=210409 RepID=A0A5B7IU24_PORTR|nr:hypothetical protein [Portunus trituberculatus]